VDYLDTSPECSRAAKLQRPLPRDPYRDVHGTATLVLLLRFLRNWSEATRLDEHLPLVTPPETTAPCTPGGVVQSLKP
jgi:hypothetical protein